MTVLAELEVWHSRPVAPTRRVALGFSTLPTDPPPGPGGILLASVVGAFAQGFDDDDWIDDLHRLIDELGRGRTIPQPRLRHRFQVDRIGLTRSVHRLSQQGDRLRLDLDRDVPDTPQVLAAVYTAGQLPVGERTEVMSLLRRAVGWRGGRGPELLRFLTGVAGADPDDLVGMADPRGWALDVLRLDGEPTKRDVNKAFRALLVGAHPDHGHAEGAAAERIDELTRARRILLG